MQCMRDERIVCYFFIPLSKGLMNAFRPHCARQPLSLFVYGEINVIKSMHSSPPQTLTQPDWYKDAVLYELYVRAFNDSSGNGHGDLLGVVEKLDYLANLGVDCLWLLPIQPSPLKDDGYDVSDYYGIHPDYGTLDDFKTLLDEAHARGMKVITDLVMNHTSDQHPWFLESRSSRDNPKRDWYVWNGDDKKHPETRIIFSDTETSNWAYDETTEQYYWHRFFTDQPDLNYANPEVRAEMLNVIRFWLELGIDGFRLDAIPYLFEREGTLNENLQETHDFLQEVRAFVDKIAPGTLLLGEVNQWPNDTIPYFGNGHNEMNLLFHFPVMPRLFKAVAEEDRGSVDWIMERTPHIPETCSWVVFLRNHDELTLEMVTQDERDFMLETYAPEPRMKLNVGIRRRLAPLLDNDPRTIKLMTSLLMTLPGTPILYYGDEIGMGDDLSLHDRNGVRTPMQWNSDVNAGFSRADNLYAPVIDTEPFGYRCVNVNRQKENAQSILCATQRLIKTRKQHPALGRGHFEILRTANRKILPFLNVYQNDVVVAVHNLSAQVQRFELDLSRYESEHSGTLVDALSGQEVTAQNALQKVKACRETRLELPPYGFAWLTLR